MQWVLKLQAEKLSENPSVVVTMVQVQPFVFHSGTLLRMLSEMDEYFDIPPVEEWKVGTLLRMLVKYLKVYMSTN